MRRFVEPRALFTALAVTLLSSCKEPPRLAPPDAAVITVVPAVTAPVTTAATARMNDAGSPPLLVPSAMLDGGPSACRLVLGRLQQRFTGPASLVATEAGVDVITHKNGLISVESFAAEPLKTAKWKPGRSLDAPPVSASKPVCASTGPFAFCSDANGDLHRALRAQASDEVIGHADLGARIVAATLAGHTLLGFLAARTTTEGRLSEAFVKVDNNPPVRVSEDGNGATEIAFAARGAEVVALLVDARRAMSPVHARVLSFPGHLAVGPDTVVFIAGGADRQVSAALATSASGATFALMPTTTEHGFGLVSAKIESPPKTDAPTHFSLYPNGIDAAPIAATHGGTSMYVARVRPVAAEPAALRVLELGRLDGEGSFSPLGLVNTTGSVVFFASELYGEGGVWIYYTDAGGSWLERRACP
jgi:hypothetical protein